MFARPSTGPVMLGRTARSRRRLMAVSSPRSRAVRVRRFWLKGRSSGSMPLIPDSIHTVWYHDGYSTTDAGDRSEMPPTTTERLADYETRYRELAAQLATIGLIHSGSVHPRPGRPTRLGAPLPRPPPPARPHRPDPPRQRPPPLHPLPDPRLQMPRRPTPTPRPLLPMDRQEQRQNRHPPTHRERSAALPRMDRQRPPTTTPHPTDAPDRRQSRRAEAQTSSQPITAQSFTPTRTPPTTPRLAAGAQNPGTQGFPGSSPRILRPFLRLV